MIDLKKPVSRAVADETNGFVTALPLMRRAEAREREAMYPETLDLKQAAAVLHCHPKTLRLMAIADKVPGRRVGRLWRFSEKRLKEWLEAS
ncbi:helix-turn-helix domain-containing protein [Edaphobacter aggregans]|uniref:helix-turn-helix domain-containing protein n=1 Tax=Edaphobacter aggregans TaxID=570835 RepID=UPI0005573C8A|nr:helix-turn-helix domain-containing protein [Edaphobacter aggregans]